MAGVAIGELDVKVRFEKNTRQQVAGGPGMVDNWDGFLTCKARLRKNSGSRFLDAGEITESNSYTLFIRFQQGLYNEIVAGINLFRVVLDDGRKFTISTWEKEDEQRKWIRMTLNEKR
jgi:SPP1 family predicted phage head-tail adaptor